MNEFQRKLSAAIAAQHRRQRGRRGKRKTGIGRVDGPGMVRRLPPSREDDRQDRPGQSHEQPQQDHPHHPGTPGAA